MDRHIQIENSTQTLRCLCWHGYQQPSVSKLFGQACGHKLHGQTHISDYVAADKILTETGHWDLININTPFVRDMLFPAGCVHRLPPDRFGEYIDLISPPYRRFAAACVDATGNILGMPQRFGPFNLVVNTKRISIGMATDQGFSLVHDSALNGRFGILAYEEFNIMHIAISAGLNPFTAMDDMALRRFSATAMLWHNAAAFVTDDHLQINAMLIDGAIDFYLSGGVYARPRNRWTDLYLIITEAAGKTGIDNLINDGYACPSSTRALHIAHTPVRQEYGSSRPAAIAPSAIVVAPGRNSSTCPKSLALTTAFNKTPSGKVSVPFGASKDSIRIAAGCMGLRSSRPSHYHRRGFGKLC